MIDTQGWQQENSIRVFPFSETVLENQSNPAIPFDFIVDLKFTPDRWHNHDVYLSLIRYFQTADQYELTLSYISDSTVAIVVTVDRLLNSVSRVGHPISVKSSTQYSCLTFTPGAKWDPDSSLALWIMSAGSLVSGAYTLSFLSSQSAIDDSVVNPGPHTIRRIFIEPVATNSPTSQVPPIPPESTWGREVTQKIIGGDNISITQDLADPSMIILDSIPGAGDGGTPGVSGELLWINDVSGSGPTSNVTLSTSDCLHHIEQPPVDGGGVVANTIQILSSCLPCCSCEEYRAVSAAISRRSQKLKDLCTILSNMIQANTALYNEAVDTINNARAPIVQVRNLRVYPNYFKVSLQNVCVLPAYIHFSINITGNDPTVLPSQFSIVDGDSILYVGVPPTLPPLVGTSKDYAGSFSNQVPTVAGVTDYCTQSPVAPGSFVDLIFVDNTELSRDIRTIGITVDAYSNGIYGANKNYGCKLDHYTAKVVDGQPITLNSCGKPNTIPQWDIKQLVP